MKEFSIKTNPTGWYSRDDIWKAGNVGAAPGQELYPPMEGQKERALRLAEQCKKAVENRDLSWMD